MHLMLSGYHYAELRCTRILCHFQRNRAALEWLLGFKLLFASPHFPLTQVLLLTDAAALHHAVSLDIHCCVL